MLKYLFEKKHAHTRQQARSLFQTAFDAVSTPFCLCEGLEIIATNPVFDRLFAIDEAVREHLMLHTLLPSQQGLDQLFATPGTPKLVEQLSATLTRVSITGHQWQPNPHFLLLEWEDLSAMGPHGPTCGESRGL